MTEPQNPQSSDNGPEAPAPQQTGPEQTPPTGQPQFPTPPVGAYPAGAVVLPQPERPDTIKLGLQFWVGVVVLNLIALVGLYPMMRSEIVTMAQDAAKEQPEAGIDPESMATFSTIAGLVIVALIGITIAGLLALMVWQGRGWARIALSFIAVFIAVMTVFDVFGTVFGVQPEGPQIPTWVMVPRILAAVAAIGAAWVLMNAASTQFCKAMDEYRQKRKQLTYPAGGPR